MALHEGLDFVKGQLTNTYPEVPHWHGIVQILMVVLIAILVLVRKFILIDLTQEKPFMMLGLAASTFALDAMYWMISEQDQRAVKDDGLNG